jgi:O-antigen/teichoic acid export membrane protein
MYLSTTRAMQLYQLMRAGAGVLTGVVLAKSMLSTAEIGTWEALLFLGTLVLFTGVNGLLQGIAPVYMPLGAVQRKQFLFQVFLVFGAIGLSFYLILIIGNHWLIPAITGLPELPGFYWFSSYLFLNIITLPVEIVYLLHNKPKSIVVWGILGFGGQMLAIAIPALLGWGLTSGLQCLCLLALLKLIWTIIIIIKYTTSTLPNFSTKTYLAASTPLALNSFTGNLISLFDGWLVGNWFANPVIFAIFRYGSREFPWASALSTALGTATVPDIATNKDIGINALKQRGTRLLHVVMPPSILLMLLTPTLFPIVFSAAFTEAAPLFQIYLLVTLSRVLLPNSILIGIGQSKVIFWTGIGELAMKVITGFLMLHWWGLAGIGWSVVVSYWFEKLVLAGYLWRNMGITPAKWLNWRLYLGYSLLLGLAYLIS